MRFYLINELGDKLKMKDKRSITSWLQENNIPTLKVGNKLCVDSFLFDFKLQQISVESLKIAYPSSWFKIFETVTKDEKMIEAIRTIYPKQNTVNKNTNRKRKFIR